MEKDTAKKKKILSMLMAVPQLEIEFIKACEGKKLTEVELDEWGYKQFSEKYNPFGTLPAFGCSISHYQLYKRITKAKDKYALILEDDATINSNFKEQIAKVETFISRSEQPIAILLSPHFSYHKNDVKKIDETLRITKVKTGYMTSGYLVNNRAAELLANNLFPIRFLADDWSEFVKLGIKLYGTLPHLTSFPLEPGEIGESLVEIENNESKIQQIRHIIGRCKAKIYYILRYIKGYRYSHRTW